MIAYGYRGTTSGVIVWKKFTEVGTVWVTPGSYMLELLRQVRLLFLRINCRRKIIL